MKRTMLFFATISLCLASFVGVEAQRHKRKRAPSARSGVTVITVDAQGREIKRKKSRQVALAIEGLDENGALVLRPVDPVRTKPAHERHRRSAKRQRNRIRK